MLLMVGILDLSIWLEAHKIVAKVLANRLKGVQDKIISTPQNACIGERQILGSVLIANE